MSRSLSSPPLSPSTSSNSSRALDREAAPSSGVGYPFSASASDKSASALAACSSPVPSSASSFEFCFDSAQLMASASGSPKEVGLTGNETTYSRVVQTVPLSSSRLNQLNSALPIFPNSAPLPSPSEPKPFPFREFTLEAPTGSKLNAVAPAFEPFKFVSSLRRPSLAQTITASSLPPTSSPSPAPSSSSPPSSPPSPTHGGELPSVPATPPTWRDDEVAAWAWASPGRLVKPESDGNVSTAVGEFSGVGVTGSDKPLHWQSREVADGRPSYREPEDGFPYGAFSQWQQSSVPYGGVSESLPAGRDERVSSIGGAPRQARSESLGSSGASGTSETDAIETIIAPPARSTLPPTAPSFHPQTSYLHQPQTQPQVNYTYQPHQSGFAPAPCISFGTAVAATKETYRFELQQAEQALARETAAYNARTAAITRRTSSISSVASSMSSNAGYGCYTYNYGGLTSQVPRAAVFLDHREVQHQLSAALGNSSRPLHPSLAHALAADQAFANSWSEVMRLRALASGAVMAMPNIGAGAGYGPGVVEGVHGPSATNRKSNLYKSELCRSWEEKGSCRYGSKCQFAHGPEDLRPAIRHPKWKSEICRTFYESGACPYGKRCCFIHTTDSQGAPATVSTVGPSSPTRARADSYDAVSAPGGGSRLAQRTSSNLANPVAEAPTATFGPGLSSYLASTSTSPRERTNSDMSNSVNKVSSNVEQMRIQMGPRFGNRDQVPAQEAPAPRSRLERLQSTSGSTRRSPPLASPPSSSTLQSASGAVTFTNPFEGTAPYMFGLLDTWSNGQNAEGNQSLAFV